ncbi:MAG: ribose-5-phosphate isomerase [Desulfitibacter sp. BRH_c19]|nr:MAG: ribose-5-phosphate isomerase [Desulfitibacter sp. BRH_c19]
MKVAIASDHGGFVLKGKVIEFLKEKGIEHSDMGTYNCESVDYPEFGEKVALAVSQGGFDRGICVCGTGIGIGIAANKVPGIRAALCHDTFSARAAREHNDTNILCLGERVIGPGLAMDIIDIWLKTDFAGGRHSKRVDKVTEIERKYNR